MQLAGPVADGGEGKVSRNTHLPEIASMGTVAIVSYPPQDSGQGDSYDEPDGAQPRQGYEAFAAGFSEHGDPPRRPRTGIIVAVSIASVAAVVAALALIVKAAPGRSPPPSCRRGRAVTSVRPPD
jgi:hypothetical protein